MTTTPPTPRSLTGALAAGLLMLGGCAVGPDYARPAVETGSRYAEAATPAGPAAGPDVPGDWWTSFGSPALDALIAQALHTNPTLQAARHALRAAQATRLAQESAFWPQVQAGYTPARTKIAGNLGGNSPGVQGDGSVISTGARAPASEGGTAPFNSPVIYNFHTAQVSVSYAADIFGSNRRQVQAAQAQADTQRFELQAARTTLAANLAAAAIQDGRLREEARAVEDGIAAARSALELIARQRRAGYSAAQDEVQQHAALIALQLALPPLTLQLEQNRDLMRALLGSPQDRALPEFHLADFHLPQSLPGSVPSQLLEQRPDVRAAEEQLKAATAQVGVARAARLPQFSITGNAGGAAAHLSQMFTAGGRFFDLTGNLVAPIFDAGGARHREQAAQALMDQSEAQYRAAVVAALQGVADVLHAIDGDLAAVELARSAHAAAQQSWRTARQRLAAGYADRVATLSAELAAHQAEQQLAALQATQLTNAVALCQALGGGWWNATDPQLSQINP